MPKKLTETDNIKLTVADACMNALIVNAGRNMEYTLRTDRWPKGYKQAVNNLSDAMFEFYMNEVARGVRP